MGAKLKEPPSVNWLALQKVCELLSFLMRGQISKVLQEINPNPPNPRKKRKLGHESAPEQHFKRGEPSSPSVSTPAQTAQNSAPSATGLPTGMKNGESIDSLRGMILGELDDRYTDHQKQYVSKHQISENADRLNLAKVREIRRP